MAISTCRECGGQVSTEAEACPHCGVAKPARRGDPCRECGTGLLEPADVCPHCGAPNPLRHQKSEKPEREHTEAVRTWVYEQLSDGAASVNQVYSALVERGLDQTVAHRMVMSTLKDVERGVRKPGTVEREPGIQELGNNSGEGGGSVVPAEVGGWNWGAFLLSWIWGLGNNTYIALVALIPIVGFVMAFVLGARGNEWAWQNRRWESLAKFKEAQRSWAVYGVLAWVVLFALYGVLASY